MEITTSNQKSIPAFHRTERNQKSEMGNAVNESLSRLKRTRRKRRDIKKKKKKKKKIKNYVSSCDEKNDDNNEEEEKEEVEKKIVALQKIVPGGESLGVDKLFEETAGYILTLQCQIKAMIVLTSFVEGLEKEKRKLGG